MDIDAIVNQPEQNLRIVMRALCDNPKFRSRAALLLSKLPGAIDGKSTAATVELKDVDTKNGRKRKPTGNLQICIQCDEPFYDDDKTKSCWHHYEEMEWDEEASTWDDWDERCHGPCDTSANRRDNPEGFVFLCCGEDGTSDGCVWGRHRAADGKRGKYTGEAPSEGECDGDERSGVIEISDEDEDEDEDEE
ncbi:hypothetical protein B0T19DRAFT_420320 [Cercophora scortea]|uniref:Uncharacterized protein n=1 Tax=Cercophora scortea TaxID=314031 RepID=A0AAE0IZL9_9PEZI|nr:hypothetical protein B0T19DRAFT_420320 [Cercophora scortea]